MATNVRSHAKINLGLYVGAPRPDGFHALTTVYQTLELYDLVTVTARRAAKAVLRLTSNDNRVPCDARNTAWKMVALALEALDMTAEVEIHIEKRLPVQGGLGAGSANAVAALVGLEVELGVRGIPPIEQKTLDGWGAENSCGYSLVPKSEGPGALGTQSIAEGGTAGPSTAFGTKNVPNSAQDDRSIWWANRLEIAAQVGSDVPLFLIGGAILGLDRGQQVYPLQDFAPLWCVVATPEVGVSTPQAFRDWDALCAAEGLTPEASTDKLNELSHAYANAFSGAIPGEIPESSQEGRPEAGSSGVPFDEGNLAGPLESALVRTGITSWLKNAPANDFERVVFNQHPSLAEIKRILAGSGTPEAALYASLSGSGSALFGLYRTRGDAEAAEARLQQAGVKSLLTRTLPRAKYWREMLLP
jgi:4-diphosphocytidyl-2-C-methyl-D-erythritol kinase